MLTAGVDPCSSLVNISNAVKSVKRGFPGTHPLPSSPLCVLFVYEAYVYVWIWVVWLMSGNSYTVYHAIAKRMYSTPAIPRHTKTPSTQYPPHTHRAWRSMSDNRRSNPTLHLYQCTSTTCVPLTARHNPVFFFFPSSPLLPRAYKRLKLLLAYGVR